MDWTTLRQDIGGAICRVVTDESLNASCAAYCRVSYCTASFLFYNSINSDNVPAVNRSILLADVRPGNVLILALV